MAGMRVVKLTPAFFKKHILPRLRPGYAATLAEYRRKHPEVTHGLMFGDQFYGVSNSKGERFNSGVRSNPEEEAAAAFELFHGTPATRVEVIETEHRYHGYKAEAGKLISFEILQAGGKSVVPIEFEPGVLLTFDERRTQLFIDGGNQALDPEEFGIKGEHEQVVIGPIYAVTYFTEKYHLKGGKGPGTYRHQFGTKRGEGYPTLCYDRRNEALSIWGGVYTIDDVGIIH